MFEEPQQIRELGELKDLRHELLLLCRGTQRPRSPRRGAAYERGTHRDAALAGECAGWPCTNAP